MKKTHIIGVIVLLCIIFSLLAFATDYSNQVPADGFYDLDGSDIQINVTATPTSGTNISNISLFTNIGTWSANQTIKFDGIDGRQNASQDASRAVGFVLNGLPNSSLADGSDIIWSIRVGLNGSNTTQGTSFAVNRTINIEYPPEVKLVLPLNNTWHRTASVILNFTANSSFTSNPNFNCQLYTNESGVWGVVASSSVVNVTNEIIDYQFQEASEILWGVRCFENADGNVWNTSINRTIRLDRGVPSISISLLNNKTISNESHARENQQQINYTFTDANPSYCTLFVNGTLNATDTSCAKQFFLNASEGVFAFLVGINDSAGNKQNSTFYHLTIDRTPPILSGVGNRSISGSSDSRRFNWSSNENLTNWTFFYGSTTGVTSQITNSTRQITNEITVVAGGFSENTQYFWNLTVCDRAGNCNESGEGYGQFRFTFPWKLQTGWSYYGVNDARINLSVILNQTEAEFAYFWNATGQHWVSATPGSSSNANFLVGAAAGATYSGGRHVIALFEEVNSTWELRNITNPGLYHYNFTSGNNFIRVPRDYSFGNLSLSLLNTSFAWTTGSSSALPGYGFGVTESQTPGNYSQSDDEATKPIGGSGYNLTNFFFSAYNNSANTFTLSYLYNFSIDNNTALVPPSLNGGTAFDVVWIHSLNNLTWNTTNVIYNWSYRG